jgi:hypothetical protein
MCAASMRLHPPRRFFIRFRMRLLRFMPHPDRVPLGSQAPVRDGSAARVQRVDHQIFRVQIDARSDPADLASYVRILIEQPDRRAAMAAAARAAALGRDWSAINRRLFGEYEEIVATHPRPVEVA